MVACYSLVLGLDSLHQDQHLVGLKYSHNICQVNILFVTVLGTKKGEQIPWNLGGILSGMPIPGPGPIFGPGGPIFGPGGPIFGPGGPIFGPKLPGGPGGRMLLNGGPLGGMNWPGGRGGPECIYNLYNYSALLNVVRFFFDILSFSHQREP